MVKLSSLVTFTIINLPDTSNNCAVSGLWEPEALNIFNVLVTGFGNTRTEVRLFTGFCTGVYGSNARVLIKIIRRMNPGLVTLTVVPLNPPVGPDVDPVLSIARNKVSPVGEIAIFLMR